MEFPPSFAADDDSACAKDIRSKCFVLVNDTFIIAVQGNLSPRDDLNRIHVLCFDENLQWAGAQTTGLWELDENNECKRSRLMGPKPILPPQAAADP